MGGRLRTRGRPLRDLAPRRALPEARVIPGGAVVPQAGPIRPTVPGAHRPVPGPPRHAGSGAASASAAPLPCAFPASPSTARRSESGNEFRRREFLSFTE